MASFPILPTSLPSCFPTKASLSVTGSLAMMIGWLCESAVAIARPWWRAFVKTSKFNFCSTKFCWHMDYSPWSERENWPKFKRSAISETGVAVPTKIGLHAFHIDFYLHDFLSWFYFLTLMVQRKNFVVFEDKKRSKILKSEKPCPPKLVCMNFMSTSFCTNLFS